MPMLNGETIKSIIPAEVSITKFQGCNAAIKLVCQLIMELICSI